MVKPWGQNSELNFDLAFQKQLKELVFCFPPHSHYRHHPHSYQTDEQHNFFFYHKNVVNTVGILHKITEFWIPWLFSQMHSYLLLVDYKILVGLP